MKLDDTCKCGAIFHASGTARAVQRTWAAWVNVHGHCRGDDREIVYMMQDEETS